MNAEKNAIKYVIEANKLTKYYGKSKGIEDLDLAVEQGDFFGFIGPNGAGKSTCIRTLLGLIRPTGGSARVLGHDIVTGHDEILKRSSFEKSSSTSSCKYSILSSLILLVTSHLGPVGDQRTLFITFIKDSRKRLLSVLTYPLPSFQAAYSLTRE